MTRIEAINEVLFMINESLINSLDDMSYEAQSVDELIDMITREACGDQEPFNILPITLQPDANGEIQISNEILSVDVFYAQGQYRIISNRVYNISKKSYKIGESLDCSCKILFKFEELDPIVQNYIIKKVALKKVAVDLGNRELIGMASNDVEVARNSYVQHNLDLDDCNFDNTSFNSLFSRYYDIID